jgi:hypothetical protein
VYCQAFAPFANFVSNEEKFPHDTQALSYIEQQLFKDMSPAERMRFGQGSFVGTTLITPALACANDSNSCSFSLSPVVNIEHFRLLNGAIMRNAQTVCPGISRHTPYTSLLCCACF